MHWNPEIWAGLVASIMVLIAKIIDHIDPKPPAVVVLSEHAQKRHKKRKRQDVVRGAHGDT